MNDDCKINNLVFPNVTERSNYHAVIYRINQLYCQPNTHLHSEKRNDELESPAHKLAFVHFKLLELVRYAFPVTLGSTRTMLQLPLQCGAVTLQHMSNLPFLTVMELNVQHNTFYKRFILKKWQRGFAWSSKIITKTQGIKTHLV